MSILKISPSVAVGVHVIHAAAAVDYTVLDSAANVLNLNIEVSNMTHTVTANDIIYTIAEQYGAGACDVARLNVLADPEYIYADEVLSIPLLPTFPHGSSCFQVNNTAAQRTCIMAGPHIYTIMPGDTIQKIANRRFNIATDSVLNQTAQTGYIARLNPGIYDVLDAGDTVKIPIYYVA
ncbi:hypothetical protein BD289DRAFT_484654 [Coniella lustricola]|uniref:LysM domain-containing protein n=1 Tax=Coniella lustricola TaxID=2025994 RepID=A0A2T3A178_9PEZI|nr:hypothetical protein BD289DRAFT_484654 [Coniella lustricola]